MTCQAFPCAWGLGHPSRSKAHPQPSVSSPQVALAGGKHAGSEFSQEAAAALPQAGGRAPEAEVGEVGRGLASPPRERCALSQVNESWFLEDCTVARCEGDNRIILLGPRPMNSITCVNGHLPVKVQNKSHPCDYYYECNCECPPLVPGWGKAGGI